MHVLGLAEADYGSAGGRRLAQGVRLQFSDDPAFATINATRDLSLSNIPYQQEAFDPATGRYVRLTVLSRYANRDESLGFTEVQLFAVLEPTLTSLLAPPRSSSCASASSPRPDDARRCALTAARRARGETRTRRATPASC